MRTLVLMLSTFAFVLVARTAFAASPGDKAVLAALDVWKEAMLKKDRAALEKIFHPDLSYGHSSAMVETKAEAIPHIVDSAGWEAIEFADTTVRVRGNLALVNGKTDMHQRGKDKVTISKLIVLTVWVKGAQGWQMIARQAVRRPDDDQVIAARAALAATAAAKPPAPPTPPRRNDPPKGGPLLERSVAVVGPDPDVEGHLAVGGEAEGGAVALDHLEDGAGGEDVEEVDEQVDALVDQGLQLEAGLQVEALQIGQAQLAVVARIVDVGAGGVAQAGAVVGEGAVDHVAVQAVVGDARAVKVAHAGR